MQMRKNAAVVVLEGRMSGVAPSASEGAWLVPAEEFLISTLIYEVLLAVVLVYVVVIKWAFVKKLLCTVVLPFKHAAAGWASPWSSSLVGRRPEQAGLRTVASRICFLAVTN